MLGDHNGPDAEQSSWVHPSLSPDANKGRRQRCVQPPKSNLENETTPKACNAKHRLAKRDPMVKSIGAKQKHDLSWS